VHDLANMAGVLVDRVEQMFGGGGHPDMFDGREDCYFFPIQQVERTTFAAYHLQGMARDFVEKFMAVLENGAERPPEKERSAA
jgi:hypothetical protein